MDLAQPARCSASLMSEEGKRLQILKSKVYTTASFIYRRNNAANDVKIEYLRVFTQFPQTSVVFFGGEHILFITTHLSHFTHQNSRWARRWLPFLPNTTGERRSVTKGHTTQRIPRDCSRDPRSWFASTG